MRKEEMYFIQDTRTMVGNCMLFWAKESKGYTTNIDEAGLYTLEEAISKRNTDRPWPASLIRKLAKPRVDFQDLPRGVDLMPEMREVVKSIKGEWVFKPYKYWHCCGEEHQQGRRCDICGKSKREKL